MSNVRRWYAVGYRKEKAMGRPKTWTKIRPTRLHGFDAGKGTAFLREGNINWVCTKTRKGWFRTDEYEYAE